MELAELHFSDVNGDWVVTSGGASEPSEADDLPEVSAAGAVDTGDVRPEPTSGCAA